MARTMFVNPALFSNPRRKKGKKSRRKGKGKRRYQARRRFRATGSIAIRRNAGITPFVQNPLILSNPRRRRRQSNPMNVSSLKGAANNALSYAGGAGLALAVTTVGTNKIGNHWLRRGVQLGASVIGGSMIGKKSATMGGAFAGAMMYPLLQDLASDLLGIGVGAGVAATTKEADLDALAADLEDVLDEMDDSEYPIEDDEDEEYAW